MSSNVLKKEDELLKKRLLELSGISYRRNIQVNSDFLNLYGQSVFNSIRYTESLPVLYGGYDMAERKLAIFSPDSIEHYDCIDCILITPLNAKFSQDLNHRDFLGSILGLGIERSKIGDILVKDNKAFVFCVKQMSSYIIDNLTRIKNTPVMATLCYEIPEDNFLNLQEVTGSIASLRLDAVLALAFNISRSKLITYIEEGLVFVNGRLITTNSYNIKENDIISVRHLGRFRFEGATSVTKKGRFFVKIQKYV